MMNDDKKLKRGLKDVSPLFVHDAKSNERPVLMKTALHVQSLALFYPHNKKQNNDLSSRLALRIKTLAGECVLLNVKTGGSKEAEKPVFDDQGIGMTLKRFQLPLDQLEDASRFHLSAVENFGSSVLFFNFDYDNPFQFKKIIPMLDKWIICLRPELESLSEALKVIKASLALNHTLEYFVICEGVISSQKAGMLYERFSEIVSRHAGVSMNWLGCHDNSSPESFVGLSLEALQMTLPRNQEGKNPLAFVHPGARAR